jgi:DNA-directed RNA polymerase subunit RPC12/RpoP
MNARSRRRRLWLLLVVAVPFVAMMTVGALNAQPGSGKNGQPPGMPGAGQPPGMPGPGQPPGMPGGPPGGKIGGPGGGIQRVWVCPKCNKDVGTGAFPPANCPFCGTKFINGVGGGGGNPIGGNGGQPPDDPFKKVWICENCKKQAGTGTFAPNSCPHCGVKFINGMGGPSDPGPAKGPGPVGNPSPPINNVPPPKNPPMPNNGGNLPTNNGGANKPNNANQNGADTKSSPTPTSGSSDTGNASSGRMSTIVVVAIVGGIVLVFCAAGAAGIFVVWMAMKDKDKPSKLKRRLPPPPRDGIRKY